MQNPIRVLVIEHQPLTRIGIKTVLNAVDDIEVVGEADSAAKGLSSFGKLIPDVTF